MASGHSIVAAKMEPQKFGVYFGGKVLPPEEDAPEWGPWVAKHEMTGWSVINTHDATFSARFIADNAADFDGPFLAYTVLYDTNESWVSFYEGGECLWSVSHDGSTGDKHHLEIAGNPPKVLDEIIAEHHAVMEEQGPDHPMDWGREIPVALAEDVIGMRHDVELCEPQVLEYYALQRAEKTVDLDDYELELPDRSKGLNILDLMSIFSKR